MYLCLRGVLNMQLQEGKTAVNHVPCPVRVGWFDSIDQTPMECLDREQFEALDWLSMPDTEVSVWDE